MPTHLLNRLLPVSLRTRLRTLALRTIPTMRHLDMGMRLRHLRNLGFDPKFILDIGAASGEWARMASAIWPAARIFGIEPNLSNVPALLKAKTDLRAFDFERCFVGESERTVSYADQSDQTSLIDTGSNAEKTAEAPMLTVDSLCERRALPSIDFIKIDVQGFELFVLRAATKALSQCEGVLVEMNFFRFGRDVPLVDEMVGFMRDHRFVWYDVMGIYRRPLDDALAQLDVMFVRDDSALIKSQSL